MCRSFRLTTNLTWPIWPRDDHVAQRHHEMGEVAVKLLFDQIRAPQPIASGGILLPTTLIHRKSVSQPKPSN